MIKIKTTKERIESKGGLLLAGKIAKISGLGAIRSSVMTKAATIITSPFGLMSFVYAKETIRLYLEKIAEDTEGIIKQLRESTVKIIKRAPLHGIWIEKKHYLPVDIDTLALNNSKSKVTVQDPILSKNTFFFKQSGENN